MPTALKFLVFDLCHDDEGGLSLDASASVTEAHWPGLQAEVLALLNWAEAALPGGRGPVEEGGQWDFDLHGSQETSMALRLEWAPGALLAEPAGAPLRRHTLHLSLNGGAAFAQAFEAHWGDALGDSLG